MALLEAMACGTPAVIREIQTYDWLEDGTDCLKASEEFTTPIRRLTEDDELRQRIGENAAETAEDFTIDAVGEQLVALYEELV
jgi:glycosyltransferase involved in cell wall biosynthesis